MEIKETNTTLEVLLPEGLKASEIITMNSAEETYKRGYVDYPSFSTTTINSIELNNPRFAGCMIGVDRTYGPKQGSHEKIPINSIIDESQVSTMLVMLSREQNSQSLLSHNQTQGIVESLNGVSATGESELYFSTKQHLEANPNGITNNSVIDIKDITDFANNKLDISLHIDLGPAGLSDLMSSQLNSQTSEQIADQQMKEGALVSGPIVIQSPLGIHVDILNSKGEKFASNDPELSRKMKQGTQLGLKALEVIISNTTNRPEEIKVKQMSTREIVDLQKDEHPDMKWLISLLED